MSFAKYYPDGRRENVPAAVDAEGRLLDAGFDSSEGVSKVAMLVWNSTLLQWERATSAGGGSGGSGSSGPTTKRFDKASPTVFYKGVATLGTATSAASWGIERITFDGQGNAVSSMYAVGSWDDRATLSYA